MTLEQERAREHSVLVIGPSPDGVGGMATVVAQMLGMDFTGRYRPAVFPITVATCDRESLPRRISRHLRHLHRLRLTIRREKSRVVHIHTCSGFSFYRSAVDMLLARCSGCRVVLHIHGAKFDRFCSEQPSWRRSVIRWALSRADRVVALSQGWNDTLKAFAPKARIVVIENAVETPAAQPSPHEDGPCRFLLLARMDEWKGIDDLLEACSRLRATATAIELVLAGPPGTAGDTGLLGEKIRARGLEHFVRYVGPVRGDEKDRLLAWADAYVQPSHEEGMPIALLEAFASGLPVVATRVGAVPEVVQQSRHGLLVSPHRPAQLAEAMRELAGDPRQRAVMSRAARSLARERFSLARMSADLIALYDELLQPMPVAWPRGDLSMTSRTPPAATPLIRERAEHPPNSESKTRGGLGIGTIDDRTATGNV